MNIFFYNFDTVSHQDYFIQGYPKGVIGLWK